MEAAHETGLRTTSTIMFGHVDAPSAWAAHLAALRRLAGRTGGITEFVPLPFVHMQAPIYLKGAHADMNMREHDANLLSAVCLSRAGHLVAQRDCGAAILSGASLVIAEFWTCCMRAGRSRRGPTLRECVLMHSVARLALHPHITNIQARAWPTC